LSSYYPIHNFDFAHYVIIPAIDSVYTASGLFGIKEEEFNEILEIRDRIQSIAKIKLGK
jgi:ubiquinone biosynthesis protein COQ9